MSFTFITWTHLHTYSHTHSTGICGNLLGLQQEPNCLRFFEISNAIVSWEFHFKNKLKGPLMGFSSIWWTLPLPQGVGSQASSSPQPPGPGSHFRLLVLLFAPLGLRSFALNYNLKDFVTETKWVITCGCERLKGDRLMPLADVQEKGKIVSLFHSGHLHKSKGSFTQSLCLCSWPVRDRRHHHD